MNQDQVRHSQNIGKFSIFQPEYIDFLHALAHFFTNVVNAKIQHKCAKIFLKSTH